jgi:plasmid stabilization system protein ParE
VKFRYTLPALADLGSILDYIATHSPHGAKRVEAQIQAIIDLLLVYPNIGVRTDDPVIRRLMTAHIPISFSTR